MNNSVAFSTRTTLCRHHHRPPAPGHLCSPEKRQFPGGPCGESLGLRSERRGKFRPQRQVRVRRARALAALSCTHLLVAGPHSARLSILLQGKARWMLTPERASQRHTCEQCPLLNQKPPEEGTLTTSNSHPRPPRHGGHKSESQSSPSLFSICRPPGSKH